MVSNLRDLNSLQSTWNIQTKMHTFEVRRKMEKSDQLYPTLPYYQAFQLGVQWYTDARYDTYLDIDAVIWHVMRFLLIIPACCKMTCFGTKSSLLMLIRSWIDARSHLQRPMAPLAAPSGKKSKPEWCVESYKTEKKGSDTQKKDCQRPILYSTIW